MTIGVVSATSAEELVQVRGVLAWLEAAWFFRNPIVVVERAYRRHGPLVKFQLRRPKAFTALLLVGEKYNRAVLNSIDVARPHGLWQVYGAAGTAQRAFRKNYLATIGEEHRQLAKAVTPQLTRQCAKQQFTAMRDMTIAAIDRWPVGKTVDLYELVRQAARRVSVTLLFGEPNEERSEHFGTLIEYYHKLNWSISGHFPRVNLPGFSYHAVQRAAESLSSFICPWVAEQSGQASPNNFRAALAALNTGAEHSLQQSHLTAGHMTFLGFAAYETMSSALTWMLFMLALHPHVLADLVDEIDQASPLESIDQDELNKQPLLNAVIQESMRLVPPTPVIPWVTVENCEIAGLPLARKTRLVLSPHLTHRMPDVFTAPLRFRPERWFSIKPSPYEYLPFSGGPRRCPGALFGTQFMKIALAAAVRRYRIAMPRGTRVDYTYRGITMPKDGIPVMLIPQDRQFAANDIRGTFLDLVDVTPQTISAGRGTCR